MESTVRNRVRLWLRSERAMGLSSVPIVRSNSADVAECEPGETRRECDTFADVGEPNEMAPRGGLKAPEKTAKFAAGSLPVSDKAARLIALDNNEVRGCTRCRLCEQRTN